MPKFIKHFEGKSVDEDCSGYFEAILEPKGDDTMVIEWTKDGQPLQESEYHLEQSHLVLCLHNNVLHVNRYEAQISSLLWPSYS